MNCSLNKKTDLTAKASHKNVAKRQVKENAIRRNKAQCCCKKE